jgi:hypothetical protein
MFLESFAVHADAAFKAGQFSLPAGLVNAHFHACERKVAGLIERETK